MTPQSKTKWFRLTSHYELAESAQILKQNIRNQKITNITFVVA